MLMVVYGYLGQCFCLSGRKLLSVNTFAMKSMEFFFFFLSYEVDKVRTHSQKEMSKFYGSGGMSTDSHKY